MAKKSNGAGRIDAVFAKGSKKGAKSKVHAAPKPAPASPFNFPFPLPFNVPPEMIEQGAKLFKALDESPIVNECLPWALGGAAFGAFVGLASYAGKYDIKKALQIVEGKLAGTKRTKRGPDDKPLSKDALKHRIDVLEELRDAIKPRVAKIEPSGVSVTQNAAAGPPCPDCGEPMTAGPVTRVPVPVPVKKGRKKAQHVAAAMAPPIAVSREQN